MTLNAGLTAASRAIVLENIWRAQRYGVHAGFVDEASAAMKPVEETLEDVLALVAEDAAELDCEIELGTLRDIVARGTSADAQLAIHEEARARLRHADRALGAVVDWLASATRGVVRQEHRPAADIAVGLLQ